MGKTAFAEVRLRQRREGVVTDNPVRFNSIGLSPLRASKPIGYHTEEV
jgi:hypothetical protein